MSRYTTEVRWICETDSGYDIEDIKAGKYTVDQIIKASRKKVLNFDYPIFAESHRESLETKILKHYYTREICAETVGLWKLWLNDRLNLIMPKYNQLYQAAEEAAKKLFDNVDVWTKIDKRHEYEDNTDDTTTLSHGHTVDRNEQTEITVANNFDDRRARSDTPQGGIANVDNLSYLTDYERTWSDKDKTVTTGDFNKNREKIQNSGKDITSLDGNKSGNGTDDDLIHEYGYRGGKTYYEMLDDFNNKVINIDLMIVNELSDLFMLIW